MGDHRVYRPMMRGVMGKVLQLLHTVWGHQNIIIIILYYGPRKRHDIMRCPLLWRGCPLLGGSQCMWMVIFWDLEQCPL